MPNKKIDPVKEFGTIRDSLSRAIGQGLQTITGGVFPLLDIYETSDSVIIRTTPLDNVVPDSIEVSMEEDMLTIKGETQPDTDIPEASYLQHERKFGKFARAVRISRAVQADAAQAKFKNGILTITLPKTQDSTNHQVIDVITTE